MGAKRSSRSRKQSPKKRVITRPSDRQIRLIGQDGSQIGVVPVKEGLELARREGLDLVEVAPHLDPPTCKVLDWGRYQYKLTKKRHKSQKQTGSKKRKEIQIRPKIEQHDLDTKLRHARRFLTGGHKVLVSLIFRGRELRFIEQNSSVIQDFADALQDVAKIEREVKRESRNRVTVILSPK